MAGSQPFQRAALPGLPPACAVSLWPVAGCAPQPCDEAAFPAPLLTHAPLLTAHPGFLGSSRLPELLSSPLFSDSLPSRPLLLPVPASSGLPTCRSALPGHRARGPMWCLVGAASGQVESSEGCSWRRRLHNADERPGWFWLPLSSMCCLVLQDVEVSFAGQLRWLLAPENLTGAPAHEE